MAPAFSARLFVKIFQVKSISRLVVVGFLLVVAPMMASLALIGLSVDQLAENSEDATIKAVKATQLSRMLLEHSIAMERHARQFQVLNDPELYSAYHDHHIKFLAALHKLSDLELVPTQRVLIEQLLAREAALNPFLSDRAKLNSSEGLETLFSELSLQADNLLAHNRRLIDKEVASIHDAARQARERLLFQALLVIPVVLVVAVVFIRLITKPIAAIDEAIRGLGDGNFVQPVKLNGPKDFEYLGDRLNWLRMRLNEVEAEKMKFLRHISHELKTPLTNIREGSELLGDEVTGTLNENQRDIARIIHENGVHLQELIENLLQFGGAKGKTLTLKKTYVRLDEVVNDVINKNKLALTAKHIRVKRNFRGVGALVDSEKMRVVIDNLISNACKYSPAGGEIRVATGTSSGYAMLGVADMGPGIPKEERNKVFDAFYQGSGDYLSHVKGTGLGLSIVKEFVEAHDGSINIVDEQGYGACFVVKVPLGQIQGVA